MAVLSTPDRIVVGAKFQSELSLVREQLNLTKADVQAAVAAIDDWVVANAVSFNNALPANARTGLTAAQKAGLLARVLQRRFEMGA